MQVSRVVALPNQKVRVSLIENIHLIIPLDLAIEWHLKPGLILTEQEWLKLTSQSQSVQAVNKALNWATLRPHSEAEFLKWAKKNVLPSQIKHIATKLRSLELLDDVKFAKWWAENRQEFRPKSIQELKAELRTKGLDSSIITTAVAQIDESSLCRKVARKYRKKIMSKSPKEQKLKLLAYLGRRGFYYSLAKQIIDEILSDN